MVPLHEVAAQGSRQIVARYVPSGTFQAIAFVDGAGGVDDALIAAFAAALQSLTLTVYSDDRFDLQSGPGRFVVSITGGRVGRAADGTLFLHFGTPPAVALTDTLDGILDPAGLGANPTPPRLSFTLVQVNPATQVRLTWHAIVTMRALPAP
jgi:hypothetical protein